MFQPSRHGLTGRFERCYTTLTPQREVQHNPVDAPLQQYVYAGRQACDTVRMGVWKRTGRIDAKR
jgi:hypothetical protein